MKLSEHTYGDTPAALYLVRALNELNDEAVTRSVGKRITANSKCVNDLVHAYSVGELPAKTVANCLRLIRQEVSIPSPITEFSPNRLIEQLTRNVQIGLIKKAMRLCTVARKAERVMENPERRASTRTLNCEDGLWQEVHYSFIDSTSNEKYDAGYVYKSLYGENPKPIPMTNIFNFDDIKDVTSELLMERSNRRCKRLGKPHMV